MVVITQITIIQLLWAKNIICHQGQLWQINYIVEYNFIMKNNYFILVAYDSILAHEVGLY